MNLWLIESKCVINNKNKMYIAHFLCFRNDVIVLGNNLAILRYPKFISREQRVLAFTDLFLKNILREFIFVNLTKTAETAKTLEH